MTPDDNKLIKYYLIQEFKYTSRYMYKYNAININIYIYCIVYAVCLYEYVFR